VELRGGIRTEPGTADRLLTELGVGSESGARPDDRLASYASQNGARDDRRRFRPRSRTRSAKVSVVIPTLNESRNLPHVLPRIPPCVEDIVLVDGGSDDGTVDVARELRPDVRIVHEPRPGKGVALQTGLHEARGDIIVTLDADGSTDPAEIPAFLGCLLAGADFAKGSRFVQGGGTSDMEPIRKVGNWVLRLLVRIGFGGRYSDLCYGYNAMWRDVVPVIDGDADGFEIETLMNCRVLAAGLRVAEVPSHERARIHGESHLRTFFDGARVLRTILREQRACRRALRSEAVAQATRRRRRHLFRGTGT
jgi:Glycosyl transferase family 2